MELLELNLCPLEHHWPALTLANGDMFYLEKKG